MQRFYSRVPAAAVRTEIDGHRYALIPHRFAQGMHAILTDLNAPRMVRFTEPHSFFRNGEAYVYFGALGDALPAPVVLPFGVSMERAP